MYSAIAKNKRNTIFIIVLFVLIIGGLGALASYVYNNWMISVATVAGAIIYALIQYFAASSQALSMAGAIEIGPNDNPRVWRMVENLCITSGMQMPKVYIVNDPSPNAFATGRDPQHASIAVTTGILALLNDSELEGVISHELSHVKNYDIRVSMIVFGLVVAVGFISDLFLRFAFFGRNNNNNGGGHPIVIIFGLVAMMIAPLIASVVQAAVSRQREYLADATGVMITRHPEALASALHKISEYAVPMQKTNTTMAHMWFADPLKAGFIDKLFGTHPPIPDRIQRLLGLSDKF